MEKLGWKILAIVFIVLFILETAFVLWSINNYNKEIENQNMCYYDICGEYDDAVYQDNICYCYDIDVIGNYKVAKTEVLK
jgi:hypothetical protein